MANRSGSEYDEIVIILNVRRAREWKRRVEDQKRNLPLRFATHGVRRATLTHVYNV